MGWGVGAGCVGRKGAGFDGVCDGRGVRAEGWGEVACVTRERPAKPKSHAQSSWRRGDAHASRAAASFTSSRSRSRSRCDCPLLTLSGHAPLGSPMVLSATVVTIAAVAVAVAAAKVAGEGLSRSLLAAATAASVAAATMCE